MYAQLGNIVFESLLGFDQFQSKLSQSIAQHALIDGKPRLQRTGVGLEELTINITLHTSFCDPEEQINALRTAIEDGEVLPLLNGNGELVGNFVVSDVTNSIVHTDNVGRIVLAKLSVTLIEHIAADALGAKEAQAKNNGFANSANRPLIRPFVPQTQGGAIDAGKSLTEASAEAANIDSSLYSAVNNPSVQASEVSKAQRGFERMRSSLVDYERKLQRIRDGVANYDQLQAAITDTFSAMNSAEDLLLEGDLSGAYGSNQEMQRAVSRMNGASVNVAQLSATRKM